MSTTVEATGSETPTVGGVRASWWNAVGSLVVAVLAAHVPMVVYLLAGTSLTIGDLVPTGPRLVLIGSFGMVSLVTQLVMIRWLRAGLGDGVESLPVAVSGVAAGIVVMATLFPAGPGVLPLVSALSLLACACPGMLRRALFAVTVMVAVVWWLLSDDAEVVPFLVFLTLAYPYIVFASVWAWDVVVRLDVARAAEADLAVTRERLRFASDLHDIQGHSLQVIALKAELAERLLEAKPAAAATQISEVRQEAADALARTRELARGYRATGIQDELDNARDVLTVAGFQCSTDVEDFPVESTSRLLFGRVLREATTNVLRHAEPGPVAIELGRVPAPTGSGELWRLTVVNRVSDAQSMTDSGDSDATWSRDGAGLAGLSERANALGGAVSAGADGDGGFVLAVTVPARGAGA